MRIITFFCFMVLLPQQRECVKGSFSGAVHREYVAKWFLNSMKTELSTPHIPFPMPLLSLPQTLDVLKNTRNSTYEFVWHISLDVTITCQYLVLLLLSKINCIVRDTKFNFSSSWAEDYTQEFHSYQKQTSRMHSIFSFEVISWKKKSTYAKWTNTFLMGMKF